MLFFFNRSNVRACDSPGKVCVCVCEMSQIKVCKEHQCLKLKEEKLLEGRLTGNKQREKWKTEAQKQPRKQREECSCYS